MWLKYKNIWVLILGLLLQTLSSYGQLSEPGVPRSFTSQEINDDLVNTYLYPAPNISALIQEDLSQPIWVKHVRDAVVVPINLGLESDGTWFQLEGGARVWRLRVRMPQALSLEAFFDEFYMPPGAEFYIYNHDGTEVYGSYSERNNAQTGQLATEMIQGEVINFEYFEPSISDGQGQIHLLDLGFRYRDAIGLVDADQGASDCQVNVQCEEGTLWEMQSRAVLRIRTRINGQLFWNTGTLMNNTALDCRPLVLTSLKSSRFQEDMTSDFEFGFYRFYFDYRAASCDDGDLDGGIKSMAGCFHLGDSNDEGGMSGSDYLMLELNNSIPQEYQPYYAGWNASPLLQSETGATLHHPMGDLKKIASYDQMPSSTGWGIPDTHWRVFWNATSSGSGFMERGSLGAPLFDSEGSLIGTFTGGASACNESGTADPEFPDSFGKMAFHWANNPNPFSEKLRYILDSSGQNVLQFAGSEEPCITGLPELIESKLRIFPNPCSDILQVEIDDLSFNGSLEVVDISGKRVFSDEIAAVEPIVLDVSQLHSGVYLLRLMTQSGRYFTTYFQVL